MAGGVAWSTAFPAVLVGGGRTGATAPIGPLPPSPLNVVLILTDDQRWDSLGVMPNVRRLLASRGVTFENMFVTTSLCCPSRSSILTGQYAHHTGVYGGTTVAHGDARAFHDRSTLATWVHAAGYDTAMIGKYLNGYDLIKPRGYIPPGWDRWVAVDSQPGENYYGYTLNIDGRLHTYGTKPADYSTTVLSAEAVSFVQTASAPFFLYYAPIAPHFPATPAPGDRKLFSALAPYRPPNYDEADVSDKPWASLHPPLTPQQQAATDALRLNMLRALEPVDRSVADLVRAVAERGQLDRTVFLFTSDNGYLWGEHRLGRKMWPYEESIRVPLLIRAPWITSGRTDDHLVLNIDLASTISALAGVKPGLRQDGRSLLPLLMDHATSWRRSFVVEYLGNAIAGLPPPFEAVRTERYLYVEYTNGWRELYDLKRDPFELTNLAGDPAHAGLVAELSTRLSRLLR